MKIAAFGSTRRPGIPLKRPVVTSFNQSEAPVKPYLERAGILCSRGDSYCLEENLNMIKSSVNT